LVSSRGSNCKSKGVLDPKEVSPYQTNMMHLYSERNIIIIIIIIIITIKED